MIFGAYEYSSADVNVTVAEIQLGVHRSGERVYRATASMALGAGGQREGETDPHQPARDLREQLQLDHGCSSQPADDRVLVTSLDDVGMTTYLVIGNPSADNQNALVDVYIAGVKKTITPFSIAPGARVFPRYGINGGPVRVVSTNGIPIFTSQRVIYGNSFNEVLGYPANQLTTDTGSRPWMTWA